MFKIFEIIYSKCTIASMQLHGNRGNRSVPMATKLGPAAYWHISLVADHKVAWAWRSWLVTSFELGLAPLIPMATLKGGSNERWTTKRNLISQTKQRSCQTSKLQKTFVTSQRVCWSCVWFEEFSFRVLICSLMLF